ncbi:MAG: LysR family transcriptional regulator [Burkholderiaceae bacterium]
MNQRHPRPLSLDSLRTFEAVARRLSFSAAAEELHLTQPAISRQIKALEDELGTPLFVRGTRRVELSAAGATLRHAALPLLDGLDRAVREIRQRRGRPQVSLSTFPSFATLWLLPRLAEFQKSQPPFDIRIAAHDRLNELDEPELDLLLRYCLPETAPTIAERLFGELLTPVASPRLLEQSRNGQAPPLVQPADLARHVLLEEDDPRSTSGFRVSWRRWLGSQGLGALEPRGWIYLNYTHQQVQGALAGQGIALARMPLVHDLLGRGELIELFDGRCRLGSESTYYLIEMPLATQRAEMAQCADWIRHEAARTRAALGETP